MAKDDPLKEFGERLLAMSETPKRGRRKKNKKRKRGGKEAVSPASSVDPYKTMVRETYRRHGAAQKTRLYKLGVL
jgi:hypothetical protein